MIQRVVFPFRGSELGGSHLATFALASALQEKFNFECAVVCSPGTLIMNDAQRLGLRVMSSEEPPTGRNNVMTDIAHIGKRRGVLAREQSAGPCIVHCNDINTLRAWGLPARLSGMAVVYHHHALNRMWWPPHLIALTSANAVICVSDSTTAAMRAYRSDAVRELNPFDVDPAFDRTKARKALLDEFGWPPETRIVGWIGNFWERKRPLFFLHTAVELARRDPRIRFAMFGRDGDYSLADIRNRAAALGLLELMATPGFRQPAEANLACLDVLVAPAPREPFGRALVEAMILGTPVVATGGAGHSEIVNAWGGGKLVNEVASPAQMADEVINVMATAGQTVLSVDQRKDLAAALAPEAHAARVVKIYEKAWRSASRRAATAGRAEDAARHPE